jgi:PAS domain S-box-containing protein
MSIDGGATGHLDMPLGPPTPDSLREVLRSSPAAALVLDARTGGIQVISPSGRSLLERPGAGPLTIWLRDLALTSARREDIATLRTWVGPTVAGAVTVSCAPIRYHGQDCVMVVLHELPAALVDPHPSMPSTTAEAASDEAASSSADDVAVLDSECAMFTLDVLGRVDSWNHAAQRVTGFAAEEVIAFDTGIFHPPAARLAGDPHRALTRAYRIGEHRAEGWLLHADGSPLWAETTTIALRDPNGRLCGFGIVIKDLTRRRRLAGRTARPPRQMRPVRPRTGPPVPAQRRTPPS